MNFPDFYDVLDFDRETEQLINNQKQNQNLYDYKFESEGKAHSL